ncbi:MAG: LytTR family transcriptional regulator [Prevotella sp.]|nr:LytTR family transcriptional regulator [Prevotella sp.]
MEFFTISYTTLLIRVAVDEIVYIKADGNYSDLVLINGKSRKITSQLQSIEERIKLLNSCNKFIRVGRSLIVNKDFVQGIDTVEQTITFGGKHVVLPPRMDNAHAYRFERDDGSGPNKDIYTVSVGKEALKALKELLDDKKWRIKNE